MGWQDDAIVSQPTAKAGWESDPVVGAEKPPASAADRLKALQGGLYRGAAGLAGLPMDTVQNAYNLAKAGVGTVAGLAGRPDLMPEPTVGTPLSSEWIANKMEGIGINTQNPRPDDRASQFLNTAGMITGGSAVPGATVGNTAAAAIGGAVANQIDPRLTALGAMAPAVASQVGANLKNAVAAKAAPTVQTFKEAGATPSVGQAMDNVFLHGLENLASKFPGGAGVMQKFIEGQQRSFGLKARTGVSTEDAGRAIEKGITGTGGFLERTNATWKNLDSAVAAKIPKGSTFSPSNTNAALDELTSTVKGASNLTGSLVNPKIQQIKDALLADQGGMAGNPIPYEALKLTRTRVGSMLDDALVSGVPNGELKKLYGALSEDMKAAANKAGAGAEFTRQNNFYRARMDRIESVLDRVIGKNKQPEDIFKTFMPTDPDQANKVRSVMRSLGPAERQVVSEAVANRLGRARPGVQDVEGDIFSSETFLTNWNKLSPGAKANLFPDPPLRENMDRIAKASSNIRTGKGVYANPSGTAGSFAAYSIYLAPMTALGASVSGTGGAAGVLASAAASAGGANIGARMMTNPKIVEWLATPVKPNSLQATSHLARLGVIYNNTRDEQLKEELSNYISSLNGER